MTEIDVLMLRNDPSLDAQTRPWATEAGILFGREAAKRGVIVLNDPDSLGKAINKLYFQSFPAEARAETLITKHATDIKAFAKAHRGNIILKPLQGSGGSGVFKLDAKNSSQPQPDDRGDRPRRLHHRPGLCAGGQEGRHPAFPDERPAAPDRRQICGAAAGRGERRHPLQHPRRRQGRGGRDRQDRARRSPRSSGPSWSPTACSSSGSTSSATRFWK